MSTHVIPGTAREPGWALGPLFPDGTRPDFQADRRQRIAQRAYLLCVAQLRAPSDLTDNGTSMVLTFTPDLSGPELTILGRLTQVAAASMEITPAEWAVIESDVAGLATFQALPTPTLPQAVAAIKAQSRILKALLRS